MSSDAKPVDASTRISRHMNNDHSESVGLYLRHYGAVPIAQATRDPRMESISPTAMTLSYVGVAGERLTKVLPLDPPLLDSLADARNRVMDMHDAASHAYGMEPRIRVRIYQPPGVQGCLNAAGLLWGIAALAIPQLLARGGFVQTYMFFGNEWLRQLFANHRAAWLTLFAVIHITEAAVMYSKAWRYCPRRVNFLGGDGLGAVGWLWTASPALEGYTAFQRFNALVKEEEQKKH
ncbi:hypothetical protein BKA62DRAFT_173797 [Auriculariales sp. MPI-PUGE-AT-0066]|nr:hypothetical protein BKA62DRAFT_173797 [Auriculariales sp. MPI-PUGE-AT-0066]